MPSLEYFIVAESSAVDRHTNRVSLFNVIETVSASQFPIVFPTIVAVTAWNAEEGDTGQDFQAILKITGPIEGGEVKLNTNFTIKSNRHRTFQNMQGLPITGPGDIRLEISLNGIHQASHTISVQQIQQN